MSIEMPSSDDDVPTRSRSTHLLRGAPPSPVYTAKYMKRSYLTRYRQLADGLRRRGIPSAFRKVVPGCIRSNEIKETYQ